MPSRKDAADTPQVLLVEPDPQRAAALAQALTGFGFLVRSVQDSITAWDLLRCTTPDIVVVEFVLPDADGLHLIGRMRADARLNRVVIVLSAPIALADDPAVEAAGVQDHVPATMPPAALAERLRRFTRRRGTA